MSEALRRFRPWLGALLILPAAAGFVLADAGVGMLMGLATAATIVVIAARAKVEEPIEVAAAGPGIPGGILLVALSAIEDPRTAGVVAAIADPSREETEGEMLVLAPARGRLLDRWTDDLDRARFESQRVLTVSLATLAAAGGRCRGQGWRRRSPSGDRGRAALLRRHGGRDRRGGRDRERSARAARPPPPDSDPAGAPRRLSSRRTAIPPR